MRTLPLPPRNNANDLQVCINSSNPGIQTQFQNAKQDILDAFDAYMNHRAWDPNTPVDLSHISAAVQQAARNSYALTYSKRALAGMRQDILKLGEGICPYCRLERATTLDHFLPKSTNGVFAAYAANLAPMCTICNTLKGTKGSAIAQQYFTHVYFDNLPRDTPFLIAQVAIGIKHIATNFIIDFSTGLDANVYQRLAYQISIFRLVPRYQLAAVDVIFEQAEKLRDMENTGCSSDVRHQSLVRDAVSEANKFGVNHWKVALLNALALNVDFSDQGFKKAL